MLSTVEAQAELFGEYQGFADAVPIRQDAPDFDRAVARSGRDPRWKPT